MSFRKAKTKSGQHITQSMKKNIHPIYYEKAKVKCACGNTFTVGATKEAMTVEICSNCHPFYTGTEKLIDIAGRVEKFRTRQEAALKSASQRRALTKPIAKKKAKTAGKVEVSRLDKKMRGSLLKPQKGPRKAKAKK